MARGNLHLDSYTMKGKSSLLRAQSPRARRIISKANMMHDIPFVEICVTEKHGF